MWKDIKTMALHARKACLFLLLAGFFALFTLSAEDYFTVPLPKGIYFAQNASYYACMAEEQELFIMLEGFEVKGRRLSSYSDFYLQNKDGVNITAQTVITEYNFVEPQLLYMSFAVGIEVSKLSQKQIFTHIVAGGIPYYLGNITVEKFSNPHGTDTASSVRLNASEQGGDELRSYKTILKNISGSPIVLKGIQIDLDNVFYSMRYHNLSAEEAHDGAQYTLDAADEVLAECMFTPSAYANNLLQRAIRPVVMYETEGKTRSFAIGSVAFYGERPMTRQQILSYLNKLIQKDSV